MDEETKKKLFRGVGIGLELAGHILQPDKNKQSGPEQVEVEDRELASDFITVVEELTATLKSLDHRLALLESRIEENSEIMAENNQILIDSFLDED